jgi:hypothetical protein
VTSATWLANILILITGTLGVLMGYRWGHSNALRDAAPYAVLGQRIFTELHETPRGEKFVATFERTGESEYSAVMYSTVKNDDTDDVEIDTDTPPVASLDGAGDA